MPLTIWDAFFRGYSITTFTDETPRDIAQIQLATTPGPTMVRVDWGASDPMNPSAPQIAFYYPSYGLGFAADGTVFMPSWFTYRSYDDGIHSIRVTAFFEGGDRATEVMNVISFLNAGGPSLLEGTGRDDAIFGGAFNDTLNGRNGDDVLLAGEGDDSLYGGNGSDTLLAGAGNDRLFGGNGNDILAGGDGDDLLVGGAGNDSLFGGSGDDRLIGGAGRDFFAGDGGRDRLVSEADGQEDIFYYRIALEGGDVIFGFEAGTDKIWLDWLSGMDASRFVASAAEMTDNGAWIIYDALGRLFVDDNGTDAGGRTLIARLDGTPALSFGDFLF
jgi:Ca2+-binding RTX toxin-like protein